MAVRDQSVVAPYSDCVKEVQKRDCRWKSGALLMQMCLHRIRKEGMVSFFFFSILSRVLIIILVDTCTQPNYWPAIENFIKKITSSAVIRSR